MDRVQREVTRVVPAPTSVMVMRDLQAVADEWWSALRADERGLWLLPEREWVNHGPALRATAPPQELVTFKVEEYWQGDVVRPQPEREFSLFVEQRRAEQ